MMFANFQMPAYTVPCRYWKSIYRRPRSKLPVASSNVHRGSVNRSARPLALCCFLAVLPGIPAAAEQNPPKPIAYLDPARDKSALQPPPTSTLTEQFIWTKDDAAALDPGLQAKVRGQNDKIAPHYFRARFRVDKVPAQATLYIAGPRSAAITLNGVKVMEFSDAEAVRGFRVRTAEVAAALRTGENVLAIEEVRGHSSLHTGAAPVINQVTYGEVLVVKIVPRGIAEDAPPLLVSDASWRSTLQPAADWSSPSFDDSAWPTVQTLGVLGSRSDFLQWNADAGLYAWPGYSGIGPAMRTFRIAPVSLLDIAGKDGGSRTATGAIPFAPEAVRTSSAVTVDFGKEINGRIHLASSSDHVVTVGVSYGESAEEALGHPFLGVRDVTVPPRGETFGSKSAFRYARLLFHGDAPSSIDAQGIAYPVEYKGSFESSDPVLNGIWETGAYTAHLCMQEGIWDAPKRDRGRWMGDLDVSGRVISDVFADHALMESTMTAILDDSHMPVDRDINTIAGYSALWITGQANFYRHTGDLDYLRTLHDRLLSLLHLMDGELDPRGLFTNPGGHKVFVDWSNGLSADTPEARAATQLEFVLAYQGAAYLLSELGDSTNAAMYRAAAEHMQAAAQRAFVDAASNTFGARWQTNAMAVLSGVANPAQQQSIWNHTLSRIAPEMSDRSNPHPAVTITPYYGYYVLSAMARLNHRREALEWMRQYWGGMIAEGATSFWEGYDPRWPKEDFHAHLEADGKTGYYASLAHGWSSGPTAWLMEEVLGIEPTAAGFRTVTIRPDLAGLAWARGTEPTPRGPIALSIEQGAVHLTLPPGTAASVSLPFAANSGIRENGRPVAAVADEEGTRSVVTVDKPGEYTFTSRSGSN